MSNEIILNPKKQEKPKGFFRRKIDKIKEDLEDPLVAFIVRSTVIKIVGTVLIHLAGVLFKRYLDKKYFDVEDEN